MPPTLRWTEKSAQLPLQPLAALHSRWPELAAQPVAADALPRVGVAAGARTTVLQHLRSARHEQGGLLVGEVFISDDADPAHVHAMTATRAVVVTRAVPALEFASSAISLRMESGVWERARTERQSQEMVVGWYHSHPGLGAFFSATDRRTQAAFFPHPYSVGWVIDPLRAEEAWFIGRDSAAVNGAELA